jgi:hypothetical protein
LEPVEQIAYLSEPRQAAVDAAELDVLLELIEKL